MPRHPFETFEDLALRGTTFEPTLGTPRYARERRAPLPSYLLSYHRTYTLGRAAAPRAGSRRTGAPRRARALPRPTRRPGALSCLEVEARARAKAVRRRSCRSSQVSTTDSTPQATTHIAHATSHNHRCAHNPHRTTVIVICNLGTDEAAFY